MIHRAISKKLNQNRQEHEKYEKVSVINQCLLIVHRARRQLCDLPALPQTRLAGQRARLAVVMLIGVVAVNLIYSELVVGEHGLGDLARQANIHKRHQQRNLRPQLQEHMKRSLRICIINKIIRRLSIIDRRLIVADNGLISQIISLLGLQSTFNDPINASVSRLDPGSIRGRAWEAGHNNGCLEKRQQAQKQKSGHSRTSQAYGILHHISFCLLDVLHQPLFPLLLPLYIINFKLVHFSLSLVSNLL